MKSKILVTIIAAFVIIACRKDKFESKPKLTLKSYNTKVVEINGTFVVEFEVTDKEGDIADSIFIRKIRTNRLVRLTRADSFKLKLPDAPKSQTSFVTVTMDYNGYLTSAITPPITGNPPRAESDTLLFKFALKDKAKNVSDTFTSDPIVIKRQ